MSNTIFTATGCSRCKIAKKFMDEHGIPFEELDIKAEGKDPFGQFYRNNRSSVYRGKEGIEFPVFTDGTIIRQGVGVVIAFLHAGTRLDPNVLLRYRSAARKHQVLTEVEKN